MLAETRTVGVDLTTTAPSFHLSQKTHSMCRRYWQRRPARSYRDDWPIAHQRRLASSSSGQRRLINSGRRRLASSSSGQRRLTSSGQRRLANSAPEEVGQQWLEEAGQQRPHVVGQQWPVGCQQREGGRHVRCVNRLLHDEAAALLLLLLLLLLRDLRCEQVWRGHVGRRPSTRCPLWRDQRRYWWE
jgi:hypothetical protein